MFTAFCFLYFQSAIASLAPLHQVINAVVFSYQESQALEKPVRRVEALDPDGERLSHPRRFVHQIFDERRAETLIAVLRQDCDVHNANLRVPSGDVEATD